MDIITFDEKSKTFNREYTHVGLGECIFCSVEFPHIHICGASKKELIMIDEDKVENWETRFDQEFPFGSFAGSATRASEVKDFIRKEFI